MLKVPKNKAFKVLGWIIIIVFAPFAILNALWPVFNMILFETNMVIDGIIETLILFIVLIVLVLLIEAIIKAVKFIWNWLPTKRR